VFCARNLSVIPLR